MNRTIIALCASLALGACNADTPADVTAFDVKAGPLARGSHSVTSVLTVVSKARTSVRWIRLACTLFDASGQPLDVDITPAIDAVAAGATVYGTADWRLTGNEAGASASCRVTSVMP
jgi:hypothetical protein